MRRNTRFALYVLLPVLLGVLGARPLLTHAQNVGGPRASSQEPGATVQASPDKEIATRDVPPPFAFRVQRNMVVVRVVVRDLKGQTVKGLRREDFMLTDNNKPQGISGFSVETSAAAAAPAQPAPAAKPVQEQVAAPVAPLTYLAVYFDDLGSSQESLFHAGQAAEKVLGGLPASERVAIFTLSGAPSLDFTDDRQRIHEALLNLRQITRPLLERYAVLKNLDAVIDRVAAKPGERQVLLVSDGFVVSPEDLEGQRLLQRVIDHAVRARVTISWLDSAGLAMEMPELDFRLTDPDEEAMSLLAGRLSRQPSAPSGPTAPGGTPQAAAQPPDSPPPPGIVRGLVYQYKVLTEGTLAEITNGTGGQYVYQTNDLLAGLRKILTPPDVSYVLTFSPTALKADGAFHALKVSLANGHGLISSRKPPKMRPPGPKQRSNRRCTLRTSGGNFRSKSIHNLTKLTTPMSGWPCLPIWI